MEEIKVVIATHAELGKAMIEAAEIISGGTEGVRAFGLFPGDSTEDLENELRQLVLKLDEGESILCMTDIPGGSPARVAAAISLESPNFHVVSGLNLGMLTEALILKDSMDIKQLKEHIIASAIITIKDVGVALNEALSQN